MKEDENVNWAELTSSILRRLSAIEIVETAQKVCRTWRRVCEDPSMWRKIDMSSTSITRNCAAMQLIVAMASWLRSTSATWLLFLSSATSPTRATFFLNLGLGIKEMIFASCSRLRSLRVAFCCKITGQGLIEAIARLPLLEELEVSNCSVSGESLRVVGQSCPNLKTLKKNYFGYRPPEEESDDVALAIAETMPRLCHLQLFGDILTDDGLNAILDGCPNLEHLDLRQCFYVHFIGGGDLRKAF